MAELVREIVIMLDPRRCSRSSSILKSILSGWEPRLTSTPNPEGSTGCRSVMRIVRSVNS